VILALLLLCAGYDGKYADDPRLARIAKELPARRAAALRHLEETLGVEVPGIELRLEDAGRDPSGAWAEVRTESGKPVLALKTEYLVLGAHDVEKTLIHELFHCLHRACLGEKGYARLPDWVREGAALFVAGQGTERARVLAAFVGRDPLLDDPLGRLVDGLDGPHTFLDYYEDVAAFEAVAVRHGHARALALVKRLLETADVSRAVREVLDEDMATFEKAAAARARRVLAPLIAEGRASLLAARRHLEAGEPARALEVLEPRGVYVPAAAYYRAVALARLGRRAEALEHLRTRFLARHRAATTLLDRALLLELRLLRETGGEEFAAASRRARLDLAPFRR
jgi:tetratricopeptide (TPR) repeat protein